jgi:hypothetical protein
MSVALQRRPAQQSIPATTVPADIAGFVGWCIATVIVFSAVYYHSKTDPGLRFAIKNGAITNYGPSWWDQQKFGAFTPGDLVVLAFAYVGTVARLHSGRTRIETRTAWLLGLGAFVVTLGVATGVLNNTPSPFGDWRYLAIGLLFAFALWSTILRTEHDCFRFAQIFVAIMAGYGLDQLVSYASGGGEIAFYGRTTTGDHATLEFMVAAVGVSMAMLRTRRTRALWWAGITIGTAVVVLAFRRYAWIELAIVFAAFVALSGASRRRYVISIAGVAVAGVLTVALTWSALDWGGRFASLDPTQTGAQNVYATTNQGHIDDILDGWDQVRANPVTGLGVGVLYHPTRTARWKGDAGMVHNAPIEVWIKFGILGLLVFIGTYVVLFRDIWRRRRRGRVSDLIAFGGGAFLLGNFVVISTVYPWAFSTWEKGILIFSLIAMAYPPGWRSPLRTETPR